MNIPDICITRLRNRNFQLNEFFEMAAKVLPSNMKVLSITSDTESISMNIEAKSNKYSIAELLLQLKKIPSVSNATVANIQESVDDHGKADIETFTVVCAYNPYNAFADEKVALKDEEVEKETTEENAEGKLTIQTRQLLILQQIIIQQQSRRSKNMNKKKPSTLSNVTERDKKVLYVLGTLLVLSLSYFFIFSPNQKKADVVKAENKEKKAYVVELDAKIANEATKTAEITTFKNDRQEILSKFPGGMTHEKAIKILADLEKETDIFSSDVSLAVNNIFFNQAETSYQRYSTD